jgi:hypothetical protein
MRFRLPALLSLLAFGAWPSRAGTPALGDPLDAAAVVPRAAYASPFAAARASEVRVGSWVAANEQVARVGGWRAYAREASRPEPAASAPPPAGHHGHAGPRR